MQRTHALMRYALVICAAHLLRVQLRRTCRRSSFASFASSSPTACVRAARMWSWTWSLERLGERALLARLCATWLPACKQASTLERVCTRAAHRVHWSLPAPSRSLLHSVHKARTQMAVILLPLAWQRARLHILNAWSFIVTNVDVAFSTSSRALANDVHRHTMSCCCCTC